MITEDQLEQLAIQWFQDTGWNHVHGAVIAPEGVAAEREDRGNIEHPTPNIERRSEEKRCLAEAVGTRRGGLRSAQTMRGPWGSGLPRFMGIPWASADGFRRSLGKMPCWGGRIERRLNP
jgi:hypothetical protein